MSLWAVICDGDAGITARCLWRKPAQGVSSLEG
jgi:hypothetical protein